MPLLGQNEPILSTRTHHRRRVGRHIIRRFIARDHKLQLKDIIRLGIGMHDGGPPTLLCKVGGDTMSETPFFFLTR